MAAPSGAKICRATNGSQNIDADGFSLAREMGQSGFVFDCDRRATHVDHPVFLNSVSDRVSVSRATAMKSAISLCVIATQTAPSRVALLLPPQHAKNCASFSVAEHPPLA